MTQDDSAPGQARRYVRETLSEQAIPPAIVADIELVVTELVTNALQHARAPYDIELSRYNGIVRGEVRDRSTTAPETNRNPDYRGGLGLSIVSTCTTRWGCALQPEGKRVWFEVEVDGITD